MKEKIIYIIKVFQLANMSVQQFNVDGKMSLFIPHVFINFDKQYIANVFERMCFGKIKNVDLVSKIDKNGNVYNAAYVHFDYWYSTVYTENFQARLLDPQKEARVMHDDPWYWVVLENTASKHLSGNRRQRINLTDFAEPEQEQEQEPEANYYGPTRQTNAVPDNDFTSGFDVGMHLKIISLEKQVECLQHEIQFKDSIIKAFRDEYEQFYNVYC